MRSIVVAVSKETESIEAFPHWLTLSLSCGASGISQGSRQFQPVVRRRAGALIIFKILLGALNVSPEVTILLSFLDIGHLIELGLFPELDVIIIVLLAHIA